MDTPHPTTPVEERRPSSPAANTQMDSPHPKTPVEEKRPSSPATSTPGQLEDPRTINMEEGASPTKFRPSELVDSDESAINDSTCTNLSTTPYIPPQEDTILQEADSNGSWIAHRTRANCNTDDQDTSILLSLSYVIEDMRKEGLGTVASEIADEFVLVTPQSIPMEWTEQAEDQQVWNTLARMEKSIDKEEEEKKEKINDNIKTYDALSEVVLKKARKIIVPMDVSNECNMLGNLTFSIDKPANDAQDGMSNALKLLAIVDMDKLPKKNLVNIIRLLIAICIDSYRKLNVNNDIIAKLEKSLRELYYNNEKLLAVDRCKKRLETEVSVARKQYEELSKETEEVEERMRELNNYCNENLQTDLINKMNIEKKDLIASCKVVETDRDSAIERAEYFRHKVGKADAEILRINSKLEKIEEKQLNVEIELNEKTDALVDLDEIHQYTLSNLTRNKKSLDDSHKENLELIKNISNLEEKIDNIQSESQKERVGLYNQINEMKRQIEDKENEVKTTKDEMKEQKRKSQRAFSEQEAMKKANLNTIQNNEEMIYNLENNLKTKEEEIRKLNYNLNKRQESTQWSDQDRTGDTTPKVQRIPKISHRIPPQTKETEDTPEPRTADSTRVYDSSSVTSDSDSSRGAITKRKREDTRKAKKVENYQSDNSIKEFRIPKITGKVESNYRRKLTNQKEFTISNKMTKEDSDKEDKIRKLENQLNRDASKHQKVIESLRKENEKLKKISETKSSVPNLSIGINTDPTLSVNKGSNTDTTHSISTGTNTVIPQNNSIGINTDPQRKCGCTDINKSASTTEVNPITGVNPTTESTSITGGTTYNPTTEVPPNTGGNPITGAPPAQRLTPLQAQTSPWEVTTS